MGDLDANQDGRVSLTELVQGLKRLLGAAATRLPTDHLEACASALDLDLSGHIEWVEWLAVGLLGTKGISENAEPLSTAFRLLDRPVSFDVDASTPPEQSMAQLIRDWLPKSDNANVGNDGVLTLSDLRHVISTMEVYEML